MRACVCVRARVCVMHVCGFVYIRTCNIHVVVRPESFRLNMQRLNAFEC